MTVDRRGTAGNSRYRRSASRKLEALPFSCYGTFGTIEDEKLGLGHAVVVAPSTDPYRTLAGCDGVLERRQFQAGRGSMPVSSRKSSFLILFLFSTSLLNSALAQDRRYQVAPYLFPITGEVSLNSVHGTPELSKMPSDIVIKMMRGKMIFPDHENGDVVPFEESFYYDGRWKLIQSGRAVTVHHGKWVVSDDSMCVMTEGRVVCRSVFLDKVAGEVYINQFFLPDRRPFRVTISPAR